MNTLIRTNALIVLLLGFILSALAPSWAQDSEVSKDKKSYADAVKEIFVQGSLDGNSLFMVLGFSDAVKIAGDSINHAIDIENLRDIRRDVVEAGSDVVQGLWNADHNGDMVDAVQNGAQFSSSQAKKILANPLRSLKKIPAAYRAQFQDARSAYYETDNQILASVKYAGLAVWANVEGAYYLVIEAPIRMATHIVGAAIGVPGAVAIQAAGIALRLSVDAIGLTLKIGGHLLKSVISAVYGVSALAYSGISTGVAITATTVTAGAIGVVNGAKWLVTAPFKAWNGTHIKLVIEPNDRTLDEVTKLLSEDDISILSILGVELDDVVVTGDKFKSEIKMLKVFGSKLRTAAVIKIARKNGKFEVKANLSNRLLKELRQQDDSDMGRRQFRKSAKNEFMAMIIKKLAE